MPPLRWAGPDVTLTFWLDDGPVRLTSIETGFATAEVPPQPVVELSALGVGRSPGTSRHVGTDLGQRLRYVSHEAAGRRLRIVQQDETTGLRITSCFEGFDGVPGVRMWTEVEAAGEVVLDFVSSAVLGIPVDGDLVAGDNNWMAESRWYRRAVRELLPEIRSTEHRPTSHARYAVTSHGSWSTGEHLPTGVLAGPEYALGWQLEHNGQWHYEIGESRDGGYLLLSGPTDQEHQWTARVTPDQPFTTVPVSVVVARGHDEAFAALTLQRRAIRTMRPIDERLPIVFNDYMNTLMGDPTTEKLLPLIDAAAAAGAEYFCIDAGWYAEGDWWSTVGAWQPSTSRFPNGLGEVIDRIRDRGMVPGLWLEPEVVGVDSPLATELPPDAFITRQGVRVAEHGRHLLDLRSPAARQHLDSTIDRLVADFGIGFFKLDYNTMTGPGTDAGGLSPGHGLLEHNRAHLAWLDGVQARHPDLLLENCGSGALRMDYAMLSRLHLQSTSDQQDPVLYAPIAAAAPASVVPEQAGNWAYPQPGMSPELRTLSLVNGILGRMYLSGHLDRMAHDELAAVREAVDAHRKVLTDLPRTTPFWPLGLPGWNDEWVALGLAGPTASYLALWHRGTEASEVVVPIAAATIADFYPADPRGWSYRAGPDGLTVTAAAGEPSARILVITPA
jgi:Melibiase